MGVNQKLSSLRNEATRQLILETGFRLFAENTIERITMTDVAKAAGVGVATVYRYFSTKQTLVLAVSTWVWKQYLNEAIQTLDAQENTAAARFAYYLDVFLSLYHSHRDILRFNQFFNVYLGKEGDVPKEAMAPYLSMVMDVLLPLFEQLLQRAKLDHTMRTDVSAEELMLTSLHLMLAAVTRYAVGLVVTGGCDPEQELVALRDMLMQRYSTAPSRDDR